MTVVFDTGGSGSFSVAYGIGDGPVGQSFTLASPITLTSVAIWLRAPKPKKNTFTVGLYVDSGSNAPGTSLAMLASELDSSLPLDFGPLTISGLSLALSAGMYWIVAESAENGIRWGVFLPATLAVDAYRLFGGSADLCKDAVYPFAMRVTA